MRPAADNLTGRIKLLLFKLTQELDCEMFFLLYSISMFRHLSKSKRLLALLLPFTFFGGWAACLSVCAESLAPPLQDHVSAAQTIEQGNDNCASETDVCTITTAVAVNQERQIVKASAPIRAVVSVFLYPTSRSARAAPLPEVNQNSPPNLPLKPLFVWLCTFRI